MKLASVVAETLALVGVGGCLCDYGLSDLALIALMLGISGFATAVITRLVGRRNSAIDIVTCRRLRDELHMVLARLEWQCGWPKAVDDGESLVDARLAQTRDADWLGRNVASVLRVGIMLAAVLLTTLRADVVYETVTLAALSAI